ncbi:MAG TPA: hypothetical protein VKV32_18320 [Stellaceae bacterium]|nr:hypothetical protein [Stellaceae bacterium]
MALFPFRHRSAKAALVALLALAIAAPLALLPDSADAYWRGHEWISEPPPVYVAPGPYAYAPPPPQPYYAPAPVPVPAPATYQCNNALVGGLIGAASGGLIGSSISRDSGNPGATIIGIMSGGILGAALGSASCDSE